MRTTSLARGSFIAPLVLALLTALPSNASTIEIQFTGLDIELASGDITAVADDLTTAVVLKDGIPAGPAFTSGISLDLFIPSVVGLPSSGSGSVASAPGGMMDLDFPVPDFLDLDLDAVDISVVDAGFVTFTFGGAAAGIAGQSLPFGLIIGEPVSVSFSTQIDPGSVSESGGFLTAFMASGTGEVEGVFVPEPTSLAFAAGLVLVAFRRRR